MKWNRRLTFTLCALVTLVAVQVGCSSPSPPKTRSPAPDLNGIWIDGKRAIKIDHNLKTSAVTATYLAPYVCEHRDGTGKESVTYEDFTAALTERTLKGKTQACRWGKGNNPGHWLAPMELTLSTHDDEMTGHWVKDDNKTKMPMTILSCRRYLETLDNDRFERLKKEANKTRTDKITDGSWWGPPLFYTDSSGRPMTETMTYGGEWINDYLRPKQSQDLDKLNRGDVIVFGWSKGQTGGKGGHSVIATGDGDQVTHRWWTRDIQDHMIEDGTFQPRASDPGPQMGGYTATRDSLGALIKRFTKPDGTKPYHEHYVIFELDTDKKGKADFGELWRSAKCPNP